MQRDVLSSIYQKVSRAGLCLPVLRGEDRSEGRGCACVLSRTQLEVIGVG